LVSFILKSGLKQWKNAVKLWPPKEADYTYLDLSTRHLYNLRKKPSEYDEVILIDSSSSSGITLLRAKAVLENMGFRNIKLASYPNTIYAKTILDIELPKQDPFGHTIFVTGMPGSGKSAFAQGLANVLNAQYVKWGKEVATRFNVGNYGETLAELETENPFIISERLLLDGVFETDKFFIVVDGVKTVWQAVHISYSTLKPAIPLFVEISPSVREFIISVREMTDDAYDVEREALFHQSLNEIKMSSIVIKLDEKYLNNTARKIFMILGIEPTIRDYFNPFITKEVLLKSCFSAWVKANNINTTKVDEWIKSINIKHTGYVERIKKKGGILNHEASELITLSATASRIIDDILDEHTVRFHSEEGVTEEAWWRKRGIYLAVIDVIALMTMARRIARKLGIENKLIETFRRMTNAVMIELELEKTRRKPTLNDWLNAAERETAFREFVYELAGLDPQRGFIDGLIAQAKDDLYGNKKGGREDTDTRLNRPLFQQVISEEAIELIHELQEAKTKEEAIIILKNHELGPNSHF
jgi:hypothetical protein